MLSGDTRGADGSDVVPRMQSTSPPTKSANIDSDSFPSNTTFLPLEQLVRVQPLRMTR